MSNCRSIHHTDIPNELWEALREIALLLEIPVSVLISDWLAEVYRAKTGKSITWARRRSRRFDRRNDYRG